MKAAAIRAIGKRAVCDLIEIGRLLTDAKLLGASPEFRKAPGLWFAVMCKEMRTHEQIEAHFTPAFGPDDEEEFNKILGRIETLRPRRLSAAERAERDRARQAAHDELARKEAAIAEVEQHIGYREIETQQESANDAVWDAEYDVMEAEPATPAGAVALLRFVAELMEGFFQGDDEHEHYAGAIRNAANFFERNASA